MAAARERSTTALELADLLKCASLFHEATGIYKQGVRFDLDFLTPGGPGSARSSASCLASDGPKCRCDEAPPERFQPPHRRTAAGSGVGLMMALNGRGANRAR